MHILTEENNNKDPKFKAGDHVRISKYKIIFTNGYVPNCQKKCLWLKKLKILFRGHRLLVILTVKKLLESFTKTNQKECRVEKVIKT